jgi:predicted MPP superfamily phosphohydrolase
MAWFLLIFFGVYGGMQLLIFWKLHRAFPQMGWWRLAPAAWLLLMLFAPMLARIVDRAGWLWPARIVSLVAFTWMVISMWFFFGTMATEIWNLGARLVALCRGSQPRLLVSARALVYAMGVWTILGLVWGPIEASWVRLKRVTITTPKLPAGSKPITVAQVSDLHLSVLFAESRLENALELVREANPDMLVSTGDLVDTSGQDTAGLADALAEVRPPLGKFAVFGNHESYSGPKNAMEFHRRAGLRVLHAERELVDGRIWVCGVDDPAGGRQGAPVKLDEDAALPPAGTAEFVLFLKHRPSVRKESLGRFDLQLSGHAHGGQIFPFMVVVAAFSEYFAGLYELEGGAHIYVSRGSGTWGPPLRILSPPEVTLVTIGPEGAGR